MNKMIILLIACWLIATSFTIPYVIPTGTYKLKAIRHKRGQVGYEMGGEVCVKLLPKSRVALTLSYIKGYPSYNFGNVIDTLTYNGHQAVYHPTDADPSCYITFSFDKSGVQIDQHAADFNNSCGFGHAVHVSGYYRKVSAKTPTLRNPGTGERLR